jgi:thioredoxin reductase
VTLLTPDAMVAKELMRSAADFPLRRTLKQLGVAFLTDSAVKAWHGDGATLVSLLDGTEQRIDFDALVLATPNVAETTLFDALAGEALEVHAVGDCVAPRWAVHAIYEGRKLGLSL